MFGPFCRVRHHQISLDEMLAMTSAQTVVRTAQPGAMRLRSSKARSKAVRAAAPITRAAAEGGWGDSTQGVHNGMYAIPACTPHRMIFQEIPPVPQRLRFLLSFG